MIMMMMMTLQVSLLGQDEFMPRTIRLRLESGALTRDLVVVQVNTALSLVNTALSLAHYDNTDF